MRRRRVQTTESAKGRWLMMMALLHPEGSVVQFLPLSQVPEPVAASEVHLDVADAHASEAQAHVAEVEGASGAIAQDEVVRTPTPK